MHVKATKVAYAFLVQYFENTTIVAYAGLKINYQVLMCITRLNVICNHCTRATQLHNNSITMQINYNNATIVSSCENFIAKPLQLKSPVNYSTSLLPLI